MVQPRGLNALTGTGQALLDFRFENLQFLGARSKSTFSLFSTKASRSFSIASFWES